MTSCTRWCFPCSSPLPASTLQQLFGDGKTPSPSSYNQQKLSKKWGRRRQAFRPRIGIQCFNDILLLLRLHRLAQCMVTWMQVFDRKMNRPQLPPRKRHRIRRSCEQCRQVIAPDPGTLPCHPTKPTWQTQEGQVPGGETLLFVLSPTQSKMHLSSANWARWNGAGCPRNCQVSGSHKVFLLTGARHN